jgi:tetratricopeptide (TPR) repeat protein
MNDSNFKYYRTLVICLALIVITLSLFMPVRNHQFVDYDDDTYVTNNPHVATGITGANIIWAFTTTSEANWHPLTWLSHMADVEIYALNPRGHHLTNIFIHAASTALLFLLLFRITGATWRSCFVALLFAVHPLHVESVAWVSERKDVLSCFFWFLTLILYARYVTERNIRGYLLVLFSFILGLMAKPMLVTLPVVMLLMDYWPLGRFEPAPASGLRNLFGKGSPLPLLLKEKIPFLVCSILSSAVTIYAQHEGGTIRSFIADPLVFRIENALIAYSRYIAKTIWPSDLAMLYPMPPTLPLWQAIGSLLFLVIISILTIRARKLHPYFPLGWFWFLISLFPVIGLIQVGSQAMADRYTYIPITGLFIMTAWGVSEVTGRLRHRQVILALLAGAVIAASSAATRVQIGYWRDSISLFQHTLQVTDNNHVIHYDLGLIYAARNELEKAELEFLSAISIKPYFSKAYNNLGSVYFAQGRLGEAEKYYKMGIAINPNNSEPYFNLGLLYNQRSNNADAERYYKMALAVNPLNEQALNRLGVMYLEKGELDKAIVQFEEALRINPVNATYSNNLNEARNLQIH